MMEVNFYRLFFSCRALVTPGETGEIHPDKVVVVVVVVIIYLAVNFRQQAKTAYSSIQMPLQPKVYRLKSTQKGPHSPGTYLL